jgi:hypothetical protein
LPPLDAVAVLSLPDAVLRTLTPPMCGCCLAAAAAACVLPGDVTSSAGR